MQKIVEMPAYIPVTFTETGDASAWASVKEVSGLQLRTAVRQAQNVGLKRDYQRLQRRFRNAGGADEKLIGDVLF